MLQGNTDEVREQAEQRIRIRFIMHVLVDNVLALKNTHKGMTLWEISGIAETRQRKISLEFRAQAQLRNWRGALPC